MINKILILIDRILFLIYFRSHYKKQFKYYGRNIRWGKHFKKKIIPKSVRIACPEKIEIGDNAMFDEFIYLQANSNGEGISIGNNVRCNAFTHIQGYSKISIADNVLIAPFCQINSGNHGYSDITIPIMFQAYKPSGEITIKEGSWLGRNCSVLGGSTIGKNSIVAAGAIVTKKFRDYVILAGIPARIIKDLNEKNSR